MTPRLSAALFVLCTTVCVWFAPGRISVPDDEIVFQTTRSLWEDHDLSIEGIPRRTGELEGRPDGTFGWAPGVDDQRYGFFGHALSVVALPAYGLGKLAAARAPDTWRHAVRSDHLWVHARSADEDYPRMVVSLTNCVLVALGACLFAGWVARLGHRPAVAVTCGLAYAFGTSMFPYAGTFLSEPLSAVWLVAAGRCITERDLCRDSDPRRATRWLMAAAVCISLAIHTHVLNLVTIPAYVYWALAPWNGTWSRRRHWLPALAIGAVGLALLGLSQYLRFGDPFETGRYDHYSRFVVPGEGLIAPLVAPGRAIWLYSPAIVVAAWGWPRFFARHRTLAWTCVLAVGIRWVFVASRSDWWGGWAIGSRYLLPVVPLLLLPLADALSSADRRRRILLGIGLVASVAACTYLAEHSIFDLMLRLAAEGTPEHPYLTRSHWSPEASPYLGFASLSPDMLSVGAARLAEVGHPGLWRIFEGVAVAGGLAALGLGLGLRPSASAEH